MTPSRQDLFESASIPRAYFSLTLPAVLGKVVMLLYHLADTWFIAAANDAALVAGVSLCASVFMLMLAVGDIFGVGGSSVISRLGYSGVVCAQFCADVLSAALAAAMIYRSLWGTLGPEPKNSGASPA